MATGNFNAVRVSTHFYNMPEEVDRLLASVRYVAENTSYVLFQLTTYRSIAS